jgi:hypothetical protein
VFDDWKDSVTQLRSAITTIRGAIEERIKQEQLDASKAERESIRQEYRRLMSEDDGEDTIPAGRTLTQKDLQDLQEKREELDSKKQQLRQQLRGDKLNYLDDDIERIKDVAEDVNLMDGSEPIGFTTSSVVCTNSFISDPVGTTHLKRHKIKAEWVAGSYILIKNAVLFAWKNSLANKSDFDPALALRRIRRKRPDIKWVKKNYQIWSPKFVTRDGYTYALMLPAMDGREVSLGCRRHATTTESKRTTGP